MDTSITQVAKESNAMTLRKRVRSRIEIRDVVCDPRARARRCRL